MLGFDLVGVEVRNGEHALSFRDVRDLGLPNASLTIGARFGTNRITGEKTTFEVVKFTCHDEMLVKVVP